VGRLVGNIERYLEKFDGGNPFAGFKTDLHVETLRLRKEHRGSLEELIGRRDFVVALYATLVAWGMGRASVKLVGLNEFAAGLKNVVRTPEFAQLSGKTLARLGRDSEAAARKIWTLVLTLNPTRSKSKLVAGTKALHHVLPELLPPIDRKYTGGFFGKRFVDSSKHREDFIEVFGMLAEAASRIRRSPEAFHAVRKRIGKGMHTSLPKVLDNALVGKTLISNGGPRSTPER
jgi:hypothetical protein